MRSEPENGSGTDRRIDFFSAEWNNPPRSFVYMYEVTKEMSTLLSIFPKESDPILLDIDEAEQTVYLDGQPCALTQQEFSLLQELAQHVGCAMSRQELLMKAWGYVSPGETRTVDVHIQRLRKKLGFSCIETVYRRGYKLRAQEV